MIKWRETAESFLENYEEEGISYCLAYLDGVCETVKHFVSEKHPYRKEFLDEIEEWVKARDLVW